MKTTNKFLAMAMLLSGVAFTSCQDESEFNTVPIPVGDEVMFGASAYFENGDFVICRFSGTEPLLRIFAESDNAQTAQKYIDDFKSFLNI